MANAGIPRSFLFSVILVGFAATMGQILLIRELMVVFYGHELSTGIVLASWLVWTALGSIGLGRLVERLREKNLVFSMGQLFLSIMLPLSIVFLRYAKVLWRIPPGEIIHLVGMLTMAFTFLAPFCLVSGFLFPLACGLLEEERGLGVRSAGLSYLYEAAGAASGGVLFTYLLIHVFNPIGIALIISVSLALSAVVLAHRKAIGTHQPVRWLVTALTLCMMGGAGYGLSVADKIDQKSRSYQWGDYQLLESRDSIYGNLAAVSLGDQISLYENGLWMFSYPDRLTAEESVHYALLQHPHPRRVLLIGGGISGSLAEILKHPSIDTVDYVELDPTLIELGRTHLPPDVTSSLDDPRVKIHHTDGRAFVKTTQTAYDVIIVNLPDPMTAQLNRFYTVEFFTEASRVMSPQGVFALGATASENIIGPTLAQYLTSIYRSVTAVFPHVVVFPGGTARFFGSMAGELISDPHHVVNRVKKRRLRLQFVRDYYVMFNLSQERQHYLRSFMVQDGSSSFVNRDLRPVCYFYDVVHWSAQYQPRMKRWFLFLSGLDLWWILGGIGVIALTLSFVITRSRGARARRTAIVPAVLASGWTEMTLEVVVILVFQIFYGFLYQKIGMIIAGFMVGLVAGTWLMTRLLVTLRRPLRVLMAVQTGLAAYSLVLLLVIITLHGLQDISGNFVVTEILFPLLTALAGFLGGLHFPLANQIYLGEDRQVGAVAGLVNGIDLAGSSLGALLAGVILLPILGIAQTLYFIAAINLAAITLLVVGERARGRGLSRSATPRSPR
jgi:spermidine synthase